MQAIAIVLVVMGHSLYMFPDGAHGYDTLLCRMIYSFHMPLFMFVSGFLIQFSFDRGSETVSDSRRFITARARRLLLPYAVLTLVTFVPRAAMGLMAEDQVPLSIHGLIAGMFERESLIIPYLWFVQALFTISVAVFLAVRWARRWGLKPWIAPAAMMVLFAVLRVFGMPSFFSIDYAVKLGVYFVTGCLYCLYAYRIDRLIRWDSITVGLFLSVLWAASFFAFEGTVFFDITGMCGIAMCMALARLMDRAGIRVLDHLEGATYIIFLLSWYFNVGAQQILSHWVEWPWWVHSLLSLVAGVYVPWVIYRLMLRHPNSRLVRMLRVLLGQM